MKLSIESLESAWFINRLKMYHDDYMAFDRKEFPNGLGEMDVVRRGRGVRGTGLTV
jgi:hypothetical protein